MKIGDLVTLSAYGRKVNRTGWIKESDLGIVTRINDSHGYISYKVKWLTSVKRAYHKQYDYPTRGDSWDWQETTLDRRDLRFVKSESKAK